MGEGAAVDNFMSTEDDRHRFTEFMRAPPVDAEDLMQPFNVQMFDSARSTLDMELFPVRFSSLEGHPHYLIGMREFTDVPPLLSSSLAAAATEASVSACRNVSSEESQD